MKAQVCAFCDHDAELINVWQYGTGIELERYVRCRRCFRRFDCLVPRPTTRSVEGAWLSVGTWTYLLWMAQHPAVHGSEVHCAIDQQLQAWQ